MHQQSQPPQRPQSSQTLSTGSNDHIANTIQNPYFLANLHQNDQRCLSEQSTKIDSFNAPSKESSKGESSSESYYYNNSNINVLSASQYHLATPPLQSYLYPEMYQRLGVIPSDCNYFNNPQFPEEQQHLQCRECVNLTQLALPIDYPHSSSYIPMFQNNKISSGQDEIIEKQEYQEPIAENHRILLPNDTRFIQSQQHFHPHQPQHQFHQHQLVPYFPRYPTQQCLANTSCSQSCNICEENAYYQHNNHNNNPFQQQNHLKYSHNCPPINQGEIPNNASNVPPQLLSDQKLENLEDALGHNENDHQQEIQQDFKIEYQEKDDEEEEEQVEEDEDDAEEEEDEDEKDLSQNNQNIISNENQLHNNDHHFNPQQLQESQPNICYNNTNKPSDFAVTSSHHSQSKPQKPPRNYSKKSSKPAQIEFIGKRLNTKDRVYGVVEEIKSKKDIGKLKQFHNHLKVFMLQSCKYIQEQLLTYQPNELDSSNDSGNDTNSTLQLQQHIQYLTYFKHRFQKSDLAYFLKKPEYISMQEVHDIMNIEQLKARLLAQRRIVYLFIIISSFARNQLLSYMFSQSDCSTHSSINNRNRTCSLPSQLEQLPQQENPANCSPKLMSTFDLLPEGYYDKKLALYQDMTKTYLLEHLQTHPQTLDLLNSHVATVNSFNRTNRSLIMRLCLFQLGQKACKKKAMKFNQFYTKNYIMQTLLAPDIIE